MVPALGPAQVPGWLARSSLLTMLQGRVRVSGRAGQRERERAVLARRGLSQDVDRVSSIAGKGGGTTLVCVLAGADALGALRHGGRVATVKTAASRCTRAPVVPLQAR